jgi:hypothetical protein
MGEPNFDYSPMVKKIDFFYPRMIISVQNEWTVRLRPLPTLLHLRKFVFLKSKVVLVLLNVLHPYQKILDV